MIINQTQKPLVKLLEQIKLQLRQKNYTISLAESCTGGMLASYLTSISGSSKYFGTGIVSYSNETKMNLLKVPAHILSNKGAVSQETAEYMAKGVQQLANSDLAISITGIAGPEGGSKTKPVGTVWVGLCDPYQTKAHCFLFKGNREEIRVQACLKALDIIDNFLA